MDNVKTRNGLIFIGVIVCGLLSGPAPLHAQSQPMNAQPTSTQPTSTQPTSTQPTSTQPTSAPALAVAGGDDKPWNQGVSVDRREAARDLFLEGNRLFKIPLFARAAEKYTAAISQWKHPAFYFNLALAQLNLGQEVEAHDNLEQALKHGEEPLGAEQFQEAKKQLQEVQRQLGRIRITCPTQGAEVTLDGAALFTGPSSYEGWIKGKAHEITAKKQGYLSEARRVTVSPGTLQDIDLKLVTLSEAADTGRRWAIWKPWSVVAAGGVVAAAGGVLHALSSRNFSAYDSKFLQLDCAKAAGCTQTDIGPELNAQLRLANRQQKIAVGGYIAGGSVIAAGVVLLYLNRPRLLEQGPSNSPARSMAVIPAVSRNTIGILVSVNQ
jgi:tetratricopeptide (TPR) repeat protein